MSALGQKQTQPSGPMNARFTSKADIVARQTNVCFEPKADIGTNFVCLLFDDLSTNKAVGRLCRRSLESRNGPLRVLWRIASL